MARGPDSSRRRDGLALGGAEERLAARSVSRSGDDRLSGRCRRRHRKSPNLVQRRTAVRLLRRGTVNVAVLLVFADEETVVSREIRGPQRRRSRRDKRNCSCKSAMPHIPPLNSVRGKPVLLGAIRVAGAAAAPTPRRTASRPGAVVLAVVPAGHGKRGRDKKHESPISKHSIDFSDGWRKLEVLTRSPTIPAAAPIGA